MLLTLKINNRLLFTWSGVVIYAFFIGLVVWRSKHILNWLKRRNNLQLGLEAELAVGQELNQLMLHGCRVFHDFPAEDFNIDHIVVGPGGVFAVETKGRAKPDKGRSSYDATVVFDGSILRFPDWCEVEPLKQARRQAEWLQGWLGSAVGCVVEVKAALAIPGWFVERTKKSDVIVFSGKAPNFLAKRQLGAGLSEEMITRISHQIEARCRDVEPKVYVKDRSKRFAA